MSTCHICNKEFASKFNYTRHNEKFHSDDIDESDEEDSDNDSETGEDKHMSTEDEVEVIGQILNDVINDRQAAEGIYAEEAGAETEELSSIDNLLTRSNYPQLMELFKEKVFTLYIVKQTQHVIYLGETNNNRCQQSKTHQILSKHQGDRTPTQAAGVE